MTSLRLETFGPGLHLLVGIISPEQMVKLEKACPRLFGLYLKSSLNRLWYGDPAVMKSVIGVEHWSCLYEPPHRYYGPVLRSRSHIRNFLDNIDISVSGTRIDPPPRPFRYKVKNLKPLPPPRERRVIVFHGEHYSGYTVYSQPLHDRFDPDRLRFEFNDCGSNGVVLSRVDYHDRSLAPEVSASARGSLALRFSALDPDGR